MNDTILFLACVSLIRTGYPELKGKMPWILLAFVIAIICLGERLGWI